MWRLWAKALGEKAHKKDDVADKVAIVRTLIFATYLLTNVAIVAGVVRHWNDQVEIEVFVDNGNVPSYIPETEKERILKANSRRFPFD